MNIYWLIALCVVTYLFIGCLVTLVCPALDRLLTGWMKEKEVERTPMRESDALGVTLLWPAIVLVLAGTVFTNRLAHYANVLGGVKKK